MFDRSRIVYIQPVSTYYSPRFFLFSIALGIVVSFFFSFFGLGLAITMAIVPQKTMDEWVGISPALRARIDANDALVKANKVKEAASLPRW